MCYDFSIVPLNDKILKFSEDLDMFGSPSVILRAVNESLDAELTRGWLLVSYVEGAKKLTTHSSEVGEINAVVFLEVFADGIVPVRVDADVWSEGELLQNVDEPGQGKPRVLTFLVADEQMLVGPGGVVDGEREVRRYEAQTLGSANLGGLLDELGRLPEGVAS